ncbi:MAG: hypothetical protein GY906_07135 [bacterium]|nr:hypothetical protein [bacterium]
MNRTPLHAAAAIGDADLLADLLEQGANPDTKDIYGSTPLHEAAFHEHTEAVNLLLGNDAAVDSLRPDGATPLHIARNTGNQKIVDLLLSHGAQDEPFTFPEIRGDYLGQEKPGNTGVIFAPGIISRAESRDLMEGFFDDKSLLITWRYPNDFKGDWTQEPLILMRKIDNRWTAPYPSALIGKSWFYNLERAPIGEKVVFAWTKNLDGSGPARELYLWSSTRTSEGWTDPIRFQAPINQGFDTWPSLTADGSLFFFSRRDGGAGRADIYLSIPDNGEFRTVENLGEAINTEHIEEDPYIAPDGSYLIFDSDRPGGYGKHDLYITYRKPDGGWTEPVNLGESINSEYSENRAFVSPDGKYLFYTSSRTGNLDAYWVDASFIAELKPADIPN